MVNILHIETATQVCSVAISMDNHVLSRQIYEPNIHASKLTILICELMEEAELHMSELSAVCVSKGPGSYTGLRIGVSAAKGLCFGLDIPLISVSTLDAMAAGFLNKNAEKIPVDSLLCPMIDARRMEVYSALYTPKLEKTAPINARVIHAESFEEFNNCKQLFLFGDGADKFDSLFKSNDRIRVCLGFKNSAENLITEAKEKFDRKDFENLAYFEPHYLKEFVPTIPKKKAL